MKAPDGPCARALPLFGVLLMLAAAESRGQPEGPADPAAVDSADTVVPTIAGFEDPSGADDATGALRRARDAFVGAGDFQAALGPAQQVVARVDEGGGPRLPDDLAQLARIQAELGDFESAELNYLQAIELLEEDEGEYSISLLEPYQGLGRSYIRDRRFPEAVTALEQAQHISQRNLGLYNLSQTVLLDDLTTAHLGMGDTLTAQRLQLERLDNAIRRFGDDSPETIPFRYTLASYYDQSRMREAAREQYEDVVELLEATSDVTADAVLDPLRRLMGLEMLLGDRDEARTKLLAVLQARPDVSAAQRARSLAALGDWAVAVEDLQTARNYYAQADRLLRDSSERERNEILAGPQMLDFIAPLSPVDRGTRSRRQYTWGEIVLEFDVSADGRASNVETVAATPAGLMDDAYDRRIREAHFRPRLVGGQPQPTQGVRFTHHFRYYVED